MKWTIVLAVLVAVLGVLVALLGLVGARLPKGHVAARQLELQRPPADVYAVIRDFARAPEWRPGVKRVETFATAGGRSGFREEGPHGLLTFEVLEERPPERLVTRIADETLPFGGSWTYELQAMPSGTRLVLIERGEVRNVFFRALAKYVFGHHASLDEYLRALARRLGEPREPQPWASGGSRR